MRTLCMVSLKPSRELCGTTEAQFDDLVERLRPLAVADKRCREERPDRKRQPGAGRKGRPFEFRVLVALTHLRQGSATRATAAIFGIHERSVRNWRDELERLLGEHGFRPPGSRRPIRTLDDLAEHLETLADAVVMVDGTEIPRSMPVDWDAQRAAYSGKSRNHVVKATVVADRSRRPVWFVANPSGEGRTHDVTMLRAQTGLMAVLAATSVSVLADKAYVGLRHDIDPARTITPRIKTRNRELSDDDRAANHALSSRRMPVEHAIGAMKVWRAARYWRRAPDRFERGGKAIAILASML